MENSRRKLNANDMNDMNDPGGKKKLRLDKRHETSNRTQEFYRINNKPDANFTIFVFWDFVWPNLFDMSPSYIVIANGRPLEVARYARRKTNVEVKVLIEEEKKKQIFLSPHLML